MKSTAKSTAPKRKEPSKETTKTSRATAPVPRVEKTARPVEPEAPRAMGVDGNGSPMPDLTTFGVSQRDAQAHVTQCEPCGRAHRHVVKNPKDAMALQSFGRRVASCLADKQDERHA